MGDLRRVHSSWVSVEWRFNWSHSNTGPLLSSIMSFEFHFYLFKSNTKAGCGGAHLSPSKQEIEAGRFLSVDLQKSSDSWYTKGPPWAHTAREILGPGNDVWGWTGTFTTTEKKKWSAYSPWMALGSACYSKGEVPLVCRNETLGRQMGSKRKAYLVNYIVKCYLGIHHSSLWELECSDF